MTDERNQSAMRQTAAQLSYIVELFDAWNATRDGETVEFDGDTYTDEDEILQRAYENPLDVERDTDAGTFEILLCTGGPACRIIGTLDRYQEPDNIEIQGQDWFTTWETLDTTTEQDEALDWFCRLFYFGE